ncbi:nuclear transport factor 2 family protein [Pseudomonas sp. QC2]|uniref:nuclear transport factor 2 family protein n=1 Tax=Pseudomonas sp. QC2 TaxID=2065822 RepID=UPI00211495E9|nr:nuclear transport factor 2 family protein [Pseudomonas sp. QC2]
MAQAENAPGGPQVLSSKTVSKATYVEDYQAITEVLNKYIEGCKQAKSSIMKPAFNEHATMYSVGADGKLDGGAIPILFEGIDKNFRPSPDAQAAITRIEIVGNAASARIDANGMSGLSFTDFFQLLKVEGKWTVVSKIFQTHGAH